MEYVKLSSRSGKCRIKWYRGILM